MGSGSRQRRRLDLSQIILAFTLGSALLASFVAWELRSEHPMLPMRFFRNRTFALANVASLFMFFGMFGSIFFIAQFFQTVQGLSPFQSGLRILPWTAMPMLVAPIAGAVSDRIGGHRLMGAGLALQALGLAWIALVTAPTAPYIDFIGPFAISGLGMALFFAPLANVVLSQFAPKKKDKRPEPTTRSANLAACSAWVCSPPSSPPTAATTPASSSLTA